MLLHHKYILLLDLQRRQTKAMGSRLLRRHIRTTVKRRPWLMLVICLAYCINQGLWEAEDTCPVTGTR